MKLLVLQHVPFEGPAAIKSWAERHNHTVIHHCCTQNTAYPDPADIDCCIILGGPMSVNDQSPWMKPEIDFIKTCIKADKFMLGICLGAQLIATAMHAHVSKSPHLEIGWFAVELVSQNIKTEHWLGDVLPPKFTPLHWHGDTFAIPDGAVHWYQSHACKNQAFVANDRIIGLQFHLEFDAATALRVAQASASDLADNNPAVQSLSEIMGDAAQFKEANQLMHRLLDAVRLEFLRTKA